MSRLCGSYLARTRLAECSLLRHALEARWRLGVYTCHSYLADPCLPRNVVVLDKDKQTLMDAVYYTLEGPMTPSHSNIKCCRDVHGSRDAPASPLVRAFRASSSPFEATCPVCPRTLMSPYCLKAQAMESVSVPML